MSGLHHHETSPGLRRGSFARRYKTWPPVGFKEPTDDELTAVMHRARTSQPHMIRKLSDEKVRRTLEVISWFGSRRDVSSSNRLYGYVHVIRREAARRKIIVRPVGILRCAMCSHASERLWEATGETHAITDRNDEPITSVFICARCWSDYMITDDEEK